MTLMVSYELPKRGFSRVLVNLSLSLLFDVSGSAMILQTSQPFIVSVQATPSIELMPNSGPAGTLVTVVGDGFPPNVPMDVVFRSSPQLAVATIFTASDGKFRTTFKVPDLVPGTYTVFTVTPGQGADAEFTITTASITTTVTPTTQGQEIEWVKQIGETQDTYRGVVGGISLHDGHLYVIGMGRSCSSGPDLCWGPY